MAVRGLLIGLSLNVLALVGLFLIGFGSYMAAAFGDPLEWSLSLALALWGAFTVGSGFCFFGSQGQARLSAGLLFGMASLSGVLLLQGGDARLIGIPLALISLLAYVAFQDALAKGLQDIASMALIKRAYDRPLKVFLGSVALYLFCHKVGIHSGFTVLVVILAIGCPIWGFVYLGVVTIQLIRALRAPIAENSSSEGSSGF